MGAQNRIQHAKMMMVAQLLPLVTASMNHSVHLSADTEPARVATDTCMFDYCAKLTYADFELFTSSSFICGRGCSQAPYGNLAQCEATCEQSQCMTVPFNR